MSELHAKDEWEEDEEPEPLPIWRRRKWLLIGLGVVVLLAFLFTRGKPQHAQDAPKDPKSYIGVVVPYQPLKPAPSSAPAPVKAAETASAAAPAPLTAFRAQLPMGAMPKPLRPAMLSYVVPHSDGPKPAAAAMEAETQVIGRYESMGRNGGSRLMAVSTYAHTPNGIWVPLVGNPMADDLGRTGFAGAVDNHYLERFGGAVILSLTESGLGIVQTAVSKGGNTYISTGSASNLAEQILQSQINIAPTFSKHQGETIAIWLTIPIDFSDSYKLRQARQ